MLLRRLYSSQAQVLFGLFMVLNKIDLEFFKKRQLANSSCQSNQGILEYFKMFVKSRIKNFGSVFIEALLTIADGNNVNVHPLMSGQRK